MPLHRLPADPGRRLRARASRTGDPLLARQAEPAPRARADHDPSDQGRYVRPADLAEALDLLAEHPDAQLVAGSTDWGVELNIRHARAALTIGIDRLAELREFAVGPDGIDIGAALSLSEIEARLDGRVPLLDDAVPAVRLPADPQRGHAGRQPRHRLADRRHPAGAARAGRLARAGLGRRRARGPAGRLLHRLPAERQAPGELIKTVRIPLPLAPVTAFHKIAKRRFDDISSVAVAYALTAGRRGPGRPRSRSAWAGWRPRRCGPRPPRRRCGAGRGPARPWPRPPSVLARAGTPMSDHRASARYRSAMLRNSLLKFYAENPRRRAES